MDDWRAYAGIIAKKLGLYDGATVFEVGCGFCARLYALKEKYLLSVGGIDYSAGLIAAEQAMPDGEFKVQEAGALEISPQYDYVLANSVFHYF